MKWLERFKRKKKAVEPHERVGRLQNPYISKFRFILEQILCQYGMNYQGFCPLLLDLDTPPESMLEEDEVEQVLEQISPDLNFLRIATDRPVYFLHYIERMYEDTGLVVQIEDKDNPCTRDVNVVLDMEQKGGCQARYIRKEIRYIPFYKKPWKRAENLDILVPIGYNTVIVKECGKV